MQKNDNLVIQIAVAMIIIALMGITVMRARSAQQTVALPRVVDTTMPAGDVARSDFNEFKFADQVARQDVSSVEDLPRLVENLNSDEANIVKAYFAAMEAKDFARACSLVSTDKCRATNPRSVELFAREYQKLSNGYEYLAIKDLGFMSPSGKNIVCVKYTYTYAEDLDPQLVSEVMSYYVTQEGGELKITDRVCEKKYKEGSGVRACPIEPNARYCVGNVK